MYGFQSHKRFGEFSELDVVDLQFFCTQLPQVHFGNFDDLVCQRARCLEMNNEAARRYVDHNITSP